MLKFVQKNSIVFKTPILVTISTLNYCSHYNLSRCSTFSHLMYLLFGNEGAFILYESQCENEN